MRRDASSPKAYCDDVKGAQRRLLDTIRALILEAAPDVDEGLRYGMLDYPGIANLAAQKNYVALYVAPAALAEEPLRELLHVGPAELAPDGPDLLEPLVMVPLDGIGAGFQVLEGVAVGG